MIDDALSIRLATLLAELELSFQQFDFHPESDNPLHEARREFARKTVEIVLPLGVSVLGPSDEAVQECAQIRFVRDRMRFPGRVDGGEIPGWDAVMIFVPRRRNVSVRPMKNDYGAVIVIEHLALGIIPGHVADYYAVLTGYAVEPNGDVRYAQGGGGGAEI